MFRTSSFASLLLIIASCWLCMQPDGAFAHKVSHVSVGASFETQARTFSIEMAMEVDPTDDAALNAQISPEQAATTFATEVLSLYFGDTELNVAPEIRVIEPEPEDIDPNFPDRTRLVATLAGGIPEEADYFTLHLSEDNEAAAIMIHFVDGEAGRRAEVLYPGEFSNPIYLRKTVKADPFSANTEADDSSAENMPPSAKDSAKSQSGDGSSEHATNDDNDNADADADAGNSQPAPTSPFVIGFREVLPRNYPFLTCLLVLFFFNRRPRLLIIQTVVLAVATGSAIAVAFSGLIDLGEKTQLLPLFALLGTALLALENLFTNQLRWWRPLVIALTGLAFGFWIGALSTELNVGPESTSGLTMYLFGVNAAIVTSIAILYVAMAGFRERPWYRKSLAFPASLIALGLTLFWILLGS